MTPRRRKQSADLSAASVAWAKDLLVALDELGEEPVRLRIARDDSAYAPWATVQVIVDPRLSPGEWVLEGATRVISSAPA